MDNKPRIKHRGVFTMDAGNLIGNVVGAGIALKITDDIMKPKRKKKCKRRK